jgi:hypothetical protein
MTRAVRSILLLLLGALPVHADPSDLSGGVFITHYVPEIAFTWDPPGDWCEAYAPFAISSCEQQRTRIDTTEPLLATWYILAAWTEEKKFCFVEVGVKDYSEEVFDPVDWNPCYPPGGGLEIPSGYFPHPIEGTEFMALDEPWFGNFVAVYRISGYAYAGSDVIQLGPHPSMDFAGWGNCAEPPVGYRAEQLGALGINADGRAVCPPGTVSVDLASWGRIKSMFW